MYVLLRPMVKAPLCRKEHKLRYLPGTDPLFTEHLLNLQEYLYYLPVPFAYRQEHPFPLFRIGSAIYSTAPTIFRKRSTNFRDRSDISRKTSRRTVRYLQEQLSCCQEHLHTFPVWKELLEEGFASRMSIFCNSWLPHQMSCSTYYCTDILYQLNYDLLH